mgnify:FL=1
MVSLTFKNLMKLIENNPLNDTSNIKYVRHKDTKSDIFNGSFFDTSSLEIYQKQQETNVFKGINYIVSFIGIEGTKSLFWGVFKVKSESFLENNEYKYEYELEEVQLFNELKFRVVIDWGHPSSVRSWHQHYKDKDKDILEIRAKNSLDKFPGYEKVNLSWKELKIVLDMESWKTAFQNQKAVYLITDTFNGKCYVGSAYGEKMLLNRWQNYVTSKDGGNAQLQGLSKEHIQNNFRYSILDIFKASTNDNVIIARESWWKETLMTRKFGYNSN